MPAGQSIRVLTAALAGADRDDLWEAMCARGWSVVHADDLEGMVALAERGEHHLAVVASAAPHRLPRGPLRALLSLQTDMSVALLVPDPAAVRDSPALIGATSDQLHNLNAPAAALLAALEGEVRSLLATRPVYWLMCVDDDREFLTSLRAFLPPRLEGLLPSVALEWEFLASPLEALSAAGQIPGGRLAAVIADQVMPEMKGIEMLTRIAHIHPGVRRVLLTGHGDLSSAIAAINDRVLDKYFLKPIEEPVDFVSNIRHLVLEHGLRRQADAERARVMAQFECIRAVSAVTSVDKALDVTVRFLHEQLLPRRIVVALGRNDRLVIRAGLDLPEDLPVGEPAPADEGVLGWVRRNRRPLLAATERDLPEGVAPGRLAFAPLLASPLIWGSTPMGVILVAGRTGQRAFTRQEQMLVAFAADIAAVTIGGLQDRQAIESHYVGTMASLMEVVEAKDRYTRGHTDRVTGLAVALAKAVGIGGDDLEEIRRASALHDIGKVAVPDSIIAKPGQLTPQEYAVVAEHPVHADRILQHLKFLDTARMIVRGHHERYDGAGYPDGLRAEEIPLGARILAIADAYDAMTSARPYRQAMTPARAVDEIARGAGRQFDPQLAREFLRLMEPAATPPQSGIRDETSVLAQERKP